MSIEVDIDKANKWQRPPCPKKNADSSDIGGHFVVTVNCASNKPYQIELMPAPEVYANGTVDPFLEIENIADANFPYRGILYATDRKPAKTRDLVYENERGFLLRLGLAKIIAGKNNLDWEEARRVSLLKNRSDKYPLSLMVSLVLRD